jgi:hypothetical protein
MTGVPSQNSNPVQYKKKKENFINSIGALVEIPGFNIVGHQPGRGSHIYNDMYAWMYLTTKMSYCRDLRSNYDGLASPSEDDWFLSDFYLFHCLLSATSPQLQLWLTACEGPEEPVKKYKQHTNRAG